MALIFLINCRCGRKHAVYLPYRLLTKVAEKHGDSDPDFLELAERLDNAEQTRREVELVKHWTKFSYQFADLAKDKAIFCECGKLIDVENLFFGGRK